MLIYNNVPISVICKPHYSCQNRRVLSESSWLSFPYSSRPTDMYQTFYLFTERPNITTMPEEDINIPENSCIYFDKKAVYPRYKLQTTPYKRTILTSKADYVISPELPIYTTDCDYVICRVTNSDTDLNVKYLIKSAIDSELKGAMISKFGYSTEITVLYHGPLYCVPAHVKEIWDNITSGTYKNLIIDSVFDKYVNKFMSSHSLEDIISLHELLQAKDVASVKLGMELINGMDLTEIPNTIYLLLSLHYARIKQCCNVQAVTNKRIIETVEPCKHITEPHIRSAYRLLENRTFNNETDQQYCKAICVKLAQKFMNSTINTVNDWCKNLNFSITYDINQ